MKENPETVIYDYKYDCHDDSEVYTLDDNPCNAKFFTDRPADWLRGSITYYNGLYDKDHANTSLKWKQLGEVNKCAFVVKMSKNAR